MATYAIATGNDDGFRSDAFSRVSSGASIGYISPYNLNIWLRFAGIAAAQGATCSEAYITFKTAASSGADPVNSAFYGVDEDNHAAPTTSGEWDTDHGIHTTAKVDFDFSPGSTAGTTVTSPSLVTIFDEIFARAGWTTGNAIGIHWDNDGSSNLKYRNIAMLENTSYTEPILTLTLNAGASLKIPAAMHSYRQRRV